MDKCDHIRGVIEGMIVNEINWDNKYNHQLKSIDFWFKNIDDAIRYDMPEPQAPIKFNYCPICGVKL